MHGWLNSHSEEKIILVRSLLLRVIPTIIRICGRGVDSGGWGGGYIPPKVEQIWPIFVIFSLFLAIFGHYSPPPMLTQDLPYWFVVILQFIGSQLAKKKKKKKKDSLHAPAIKFIGKNVGLSIFNYDFCEYVKFGQFCEICDILLITAWLKFESKIFLHVSLGYRPHTTFRFYSIDFQLNTDFPSQFYVFYRKITERYLK